MTLTVVSVSNDHMPTTDLLGAIQVLRNADGGGGGGGGVKFSRKKALRNT